MIVVIVVILGPAPEFDNGAEFEFANPLSADETEFRWDRIVGKGSGGGCFFSRSNGDVGRSNCVLKGELELTEFWS